MRCVIIAVVVALALARPHPRPAHDDVARSLAKEKRAEIADGLKGAAGSLHSLFKKAHNTKSKAKPANPEVAEKAREQAERDAKALEASQKQSQELKKEVEEKRLAKEKLANDMKQMHKALVETTTTTTTAPLDEHILDVPEVAEKPKVVPPTPAQLATMAEEKIEKEEHAREAEQASKKEEASVAKAQAEAKKLKDHEKKLRSEVNDLKEDNKDSGDSMEKSAKRDEEAAKKLIKEVGDIPKEIVHIATPVSLAPPEKKIEVPKIVNQAEEEAKKLLNTKTKAQRSKAAKWATEREIQSDAQSNAASLHAEAMDNDAKKVEADMKQQADSLKEVREAQEKSMKEKLVEEAQAKKDKKIPSRPHPSMFRPKKVDPKAPVEVAKKAVEEDGRREGALQNKMQDMMGSMEKIRAEIGH